MLEDVPPDILEAASSFLAADAPRHTTLRKLVSAAFTPKTQLRTLFGELTTRVPHLEAGEPVYLAGNFMQAIKSMPYRLHV